MLKTLIVVSAIVEALFGLLCLVAPNLVIELFFGAGATPAALFLARLLGAAVLTFGIAALLARNHLKSPSGVAIVYGLTAYNLLAAVLLAWAAALGLGGAITLLAAVFHSLMGAALVYAINAELGSRLK